MWGDFEVFVFYFSKSVLIIGIGFIIPGPAVYGGAASAVVVSAYVPPRVGSGERDVFMFEAVLGILSDETFGLGPFATPPILLVLANLATGSGDLSGIFLPGEGGETIPLIVDTFSGTGIVRLACLTTFNPLALLLAFADSAPSSNKDNLNLSF